MDFNHIPGPSGDHHELRPGNRKSLKMDLWKRNIRKKNRATGIEDINTVGNVVPARQTGPPCDCKNSCFNRIGFLKEKIMGDFKSLADKSLQDTHLSSLITSNAPKRRRVRADPCKAPRISANKYFIRNGLTRIKVCKKAFIALHGVTPGRLTLLVKKLNTKATIKDTRGTHTNRHNKISEDVIKLVHDHIASFPCDQSHYSRSNNIDSQYL